MVSRTVLNNLIITAQKSTMLSQHAAVVFYKNKPNSYGFNYLNCYGDSVHAEKHALHNFLKQHSKNVGFINSKGQLQYEECN